MKYAIAVLAAMYMSGCIFVGGDSDDQQHYAPTLSLEYDDTSETLVIHANGREAR